VIKQLIFLPIICITLSSCSYFTKAHKDAASDPIITRLTAQQHSPTDPYLVSLYKNDPPVIRKQTLLGVIKIPEINLAGNKRQHGVITDFLKSSAAQLGGNAVVHIHKKQGHYVGQVLKVS
jgi:hypothetical protein